MWEPGGWSPRELGRPSTGAEDPPRDTLRAPEPGSPRLPEASALCSPSGCTAVPGAQAGPGSAHVLAPSPPARFHSGLGGQLGPGGAAPQLPAQQQVRLRTGPAPGLCRAGISPGPQGFSPSPHDRRTPARPSPPHCTRQTEAPDAGRRLHGLSGPLSRHRGGPRLSHQPHSQASGTVTLWGQGQGGCYQVEARNTGSRGDSASPTPARAPPRDTPGPIPRPSLPTLPAHPPTARLSIHSPSVSLEPKQSRKDRTPEGGWRVLRQLCGCAKALWQE